MSEYVRKLRVEQARRDLLATDQPLSTIALATGFTDQAHFSRVFKQLTGLTPGAFRRTATGR
jgi:AraC family transcriptional regulator